jgi:hypothetical protein
MPSKKPKGRTGQSTLEKIPDHVRAIGMISIENGNLEDAMGALFAEVIIVPHRVGLAIYMTPRSEYARIEILRNAAKAAYSARDANRQKKQLRHVLNICERALKLVGKRHTQIHHGWGADESGAVQRFVPGTWVGENVPLSTLSNIIEDYRRLIEDTTRLALHLREHPPVGLRRE